MAFTDTHDRVAAAIDTLRGQMDHTCRDGLHDLAKALFAENLDIGSVFWTQNYDATSGVSLGNILYTTIHVVNAEHAADQGPTALMTFATFLRSIAYHLFCAYGTDVQVTVTPTGITAAPMLIPVGARARLCKCV